MKISIFKGFLPVLLAMSVFAGSAYSEQVETKKSVAPQDSSLTDQLISIDKDVNPAAWNIRNGCVTLKRVKRIKFLDDQTALMSMRNRNPDRKKIILNSGVSAQVSSAMAIFTRPVDFDSALVLIDSSLWVHLDIAVESRLWNPT
jgi:hypothetical protein